MSWIAFDQVKTVMVTMLVILTTQVWTWLNSKNKFVNKSGSRWQQSTKHGVCSDIENDNVFLLWKVSLLHSFILWISSASTLSYSPGLIFGAIHNYNDGIDGACERYGLVNYCSCKIQWNIEVSEVLWVLIPVLLVKWKLDTWSIISDISLEAWDMYRLDNGLRQPWDLNYHGKHCINAKCIAQGMLVKKSKNFLNFICKAHSENDIL